MLSLSSHSVLGSDMEEIASAPVEAYKSVSLLSNVSAWRDSSAKVKGEGNLNERWGTKVLLSVK